MSGLDLAELKDGIAVITGSASGLGYALAARAAQAGMHVVLSDVRKDALDAAVKQLRDAAPLGIIVVGFVCDITSKGAVQGLLMATQETFPGGNIQFVGANAGVLFPRATVLQGSEKGEC
jgi:3-hydroxybutyrate dehydrogenase